MSEEEVVKSDRRISVEAAFALLRAWQSGYQLTCIDVQTVGNAQDSFEAKAALASFHFAELRPVDTAPHCSGLLA